MGGLVLTDPFHHYRCPGPIGEPLGYLALPGSAALLGGPFFCWIFLFFFMNFLKIHLFFHLSYWLRLLVIVCGDIESILGPSSDRSIRVLYSNICGLHADLDELAVAGSNYGVSVFAAISRSSVSLALVPPTKAEELHPWCPGKDSVVPSLC